MDEQSSRARVTKKWPPRTQEALSELKRALEDLYERHAPVMLIYGSYARGDMKRNSDLDVLLLFDENIQKGKEINRISKILSEINLKYQILISVFPVTEAEYDKSSSSFWKNIRKDAIRYHD